MRAAVLLVMAILFATLAPAAPAAAEDAFTEYVIKNNVTLIGILNGNMNCTRLSCPCKKPELPDIPQSATLWQRIMSMPSRVKYYFALLGYYFCLLKQAVKHLFDVVSAGFGMVAGYIKSVFYTILLFGKGMYEILMFFVNIAILAVKTVVDWGINITGWLPYILLTALVISFADAMNRMYRQRSIFPLQQVAGAWKNLVGMVVSFFEKIWEKVKDLIDIVSRIIEAIKP